MNPFVNPKKRGIQLPKGCKDLVDVLEHNKRAKCEYCDSPAVVSNLMGFIVDRYCGECQSDLTEFATIEIPKSKFIDIRDEVAVSRYQAEMKRREEEFMLERVLSNY